MIDNVLGLIPARGGSKGVIHKNKRLVGGKPLILWTIEAARMAKTINRIVISTDDHEIAQIGLDHGCEVITRPAEFSGDKSPVIDAIKHAVEELENEHQYFADSIVLLQPTAPCRTAADIDASVRLYFENSQFPVCSVVRCEDQHPARMYEIEDGGRLKPLMPELATVRRQDLTPVFLRNGAVYIFGQRELDAGEIITSKMVPFEMPAERSFNIDTEIDMLVAEAILSQR